MKAALHGNHGLNDGWERDARYQQLVELAPDGILVHDGERIVLGNAAAARLAGATRREQLVGLPIDTFLKPPYLKAVEAQLTDSALPSDPAQPVRDTFRRLDGSMLEVEVRAVAFMDRGWPSAHLVVRDITERLAAEEAARQMEERLQQAQRMETVGALAGGVAHEVNNMMQVVLGFSDFLLKDTRLPEERREDVRATIKAATRAATVTGQLLAFSRQAPFRPMQVDLGAAVGGAEPMLRLLLGDRRRLIVRTEAPASAWVDPAQIEQVVVNLVLNARDAMPDAGTLTITTSELLLTYILSAPNGVSIPAGRYATLVARDTGIGIDTALQARIFEPFFTTKPLGQGTGLGLAAALGIVTQNNGFLTVTSSPGEGAAFTVYLPFHLGMEVIANGSKPPGAGSDPSWTGATVLVIDDEAAVRSVAARSLEQAEFKVLQAADASEAIALVERNGPPDLLLTDMRIPGIGGAELARRLKQRWPALPVLFMSGFSPEILQREGADFRPGEFLEKPFTPRELVASVVAVLSRAPVGGRAAHGDNSRR